MLPACVGEKGARVRILAGVTPREAEAMGLINKVVPDEKLDEETTAWQADTEMSPQALSVASH
jgi:enoyl-CoA hydratase/carnithine racemase